MPDYLSLSDPLVIGIPQHDRGEPLVDVRTIKALRVDPQLADTRPGYALLRATVVDRLVVAQSLLPRGLRLLLVEGYRAPTAQELHFHACMDDLSQGHPDWSDERIRDEAPWFCAPPATAPHVTGAAADLSLCTSTGEEVTMGTAVHAGPHASQGACATDAAAISDDARANRAILCEVLSAAGMVNLPSAWWHWSYGDRYWCYRTGSQIAPYGPVDPLAR